MKEIMVNIKDIKPHEANALLVCDCGSIINFNLLDVKFHNEMIVSCDVCGQELLIKDIDGPKK